MQVAYKTDLEFKHNNSLSDLEKTVPPSLIWSEDVLAYCANCAQTVEAANSDGRCAAIRARHIIHGFAVPGDKSRGGKAFGVVCFGIVCGKVGLLGQRILFERVFEMGEEFGGFFRVIV